MGSGTKKTSSALGGEARAAALGADRRTEIARAAALTRWNKQGGLPKETHPGELHIGQITLPCAVLDNGKRVLKTQGITKAFGSRKKTANVPAPEGTPQPPSFLASEAIRASMSPELLTHLTSPLAYKPLRGGGTAYGFEAEVLPSICEAILDARRIGKLRANQRYLVDSAEALLRGLARVGIVALIDEATGYQYDRARDALAEILQSFIRKELAAWAKRFPDDYYKEMFRLRSWQYKDVTSRRPPLIGRLTNNIVYKRLAPMVLEELQRLNPREDGRRKARHHQWLTDDVGHPKLRDHLTKVIVLMQAADTWDEFMRKLDRVLPKYDLPLLQLMAPKDALSLTGRPGHEA